MKCLQNLDSLFESDTSKRIFTVPIHFIASAPGHAFWQKAFAELQVRKNGWWVLKSTGPQFFEDVINAHKEYEDIWYVDRVDGFSEWIHMYSLQSWFWKVAKKQMLIKLNRAFYCCIVILVCLVLYRWHLRKKTIEFI